MKKMALTIALFAGLAAQLVMGFGPAVKSAAAAEQNTIITVDMHLTGETTAEGTFTSKGALNDSGSATETFSINPPKVAGVKVLAGKQGNITLNFEGDMAPVQGTPNVRVQGRWEIVSGDGAYTSISGSGSVDTMLNLQTGTLQAEYAGSVQQGSQPVGMPRTGTSGASDFGPLLLLAIIIVACGSTFRLKSNFFRSL